MKYFSKVISTLNRLRKDRFIRMGVPLMVIVVGGSVFLEQFSKIRYKYGRQVSKAIREDIEKGGIDLKPNKETNIEAQYQKIKNLNLDNWEQKRIQRPWDESADSN